MLRPDLSGHAGGRSATPAGIEPWCADLLRLLDAQGCERAVIGGHCLGANVAAHFAARHPQRAAGAILIEPMPSQALQGGLRRLRPLRRAFRFMGATARALNRAGIRRSRIPAMDLEAWDKAVEAGNIPLASFASPLSDLRFVPSAGYFSSLAALFEPLPQRLACPVLALLSKKSALSDPSRTRAAMESLGNAQIVELPTEHWIPTEQPAAMRAAMEAWLARR